MHTEWAMIDYSGILLRMTFIWLINAVILVNRQFEQLLAITSVRTKVSHTFQWITSTAFTDSVDQDDKNWFIGACRKISPRLEFGCHSPLESSPPKMWHWAKMAGKSAHAGCLVLVFVFCVSCLCKHKPIYRTLILPQHWIVQYL